jgi:hypothetical protein
MKNNTSSVLLSLVFLGVMAFIMSPTSTKNRVLKSIETLFNMDNGSLQRAYSEIKGNSNDGTSSDKTYHSTEATEYFKEICLEGESGEVYSSTLKWDRDVKIFVHGYCPQYMMTELNDIVSDLNELIDPINIKIVSNKSEANHYLFLGSAKGFDQAYPIIKERNLVHASGYFEMHKTKGYCFVDMIKTGNDTQAQKSILREEITQSLGLCNDSWKYPNSIFYQGSSTNTEFSDLDKEIIQMLYNE